MNAKLIKAHKLNNISTFSAGQCYDVAQVLRYLLGRTSEEWEIREIENYITRVENRLKKVVRS